MVSGQPVVAKKKNFFFDKSFLYIKRNILSYRASLYLAPRVRMRRANRPPKYLRSLIFRLDALEKEKKGRPKRDIIET